MHQRFLLPSFIVAYNHLMNGVDTYDQVRGTNSCLRKENRVSTSIFDFVLDSEIQNAYSIYNILFSTPNNQLMKFRKFKRTISIQIVSKQVINNDKIYKLPHNKSFNPKNLINGVCPEINHLPHNK